MIISTSYFNKVKFIPNTTVAICGKSPEWYVGHQYKKLAPKYSTFIKYKQDNNWDIYVSEFYELVLNKLDPYQVLSELSQFGNNITLLCYESPSQNCHRHLVRNWLNQSLHTNYTELQL